MFRWFVLLSVVFRSLTALGSLVFPSDTEWRYWPGRAEASPGDASAWRGLGFDDRSWAVGKAPFYYEDQPGSAEAYTGNTQLTDMRGNYSCVFLRKTFTISNPSDIQALELATFCDDGFIAWINGAEVARFNMAAGEIPYDGVAQGALQEPLSTQATTLRQTDAHLVQGENVIAVQAFNSGLSSSSDFVISMQMTSSVDDQAPTVDRVIPSANALVQHLTQVEVLFSEDVAGVDAEDLLINGQPAAKMTPFNGAQYLFEFPQPPGGPVTLSWAGGHGIHDLSSAANPFGGGTWTYTLDPNATPPGLIISEFMADNRKTLHDEDGDSSDWIEIFNAGSSTESLNGYGLSTRANMVAWRFPNVTLLPNQYLVVFASEKNRTTVGRNLHTNFKLDREAGYLALTDLTGKAVSEFVSYPAQLRDVSYGRDRGNPNFLGYFVLPTPGAVNAAGGPGFSPAVQFSLCTGPGNSPGVKLIARTWTVELIVIGPA